MTYVLGISQDKLSNSFPLKFSCTHSLYPISVMVPRSWTVARLRKTSYPLVSTVRFKLSPDSIGVTGVVRSGRDCQLGVPLLVHNLSLGKQLTKHHKRSYLISSTGKRPKRQLKPTISYKDSRKENRGSNTVGERREPT